MNATTAAAAAPGCTPVAGATHFRWEKMSGDSPMALLERRRVMGKQMMISRVALTKGCDVQVHAHENEQITCVLTGRLRFTLGPERRECVVGPGEVLLLPANVPHGAYALEDTVVLDLFSPPSQTTGIDHHNH